MHQYYLLVDSKILENVTFTMIIARLPTYATTYIKKDKKKNTTS